jgi:hypothetical protein
MVADDLKESSHKVMIKSHVRSAELEVPVDDAFLVRGRASEASVDSGNSKAADRGDGRVGGGRFTVAGDYGVLDDPKFTLVSPCPSRAIDWPLTFARRAIG